MAEVQAVLEHLHTIDNTTIPVSLPVFGEPPAEDLLVPWIVTALRAHFLEALAEVVPVPPDESQTPGGRLKYLRAAAEKALGLVLHEGRTPVDAITSVGGELAGQPLGEEPTAGFALAREMQSGYRAAGNEVDSLVGALDGDFVSPDPGGSADRNPGAVPTGRGRFTLNPEAVPSQPSWELGRRHEAGGTYPKKVDFTLSSFATFEDFAVMESQILDLVGVRPVWVARNLVAGVELIPRAELGRPRIDVFLC